LIAGSRFLRASAGFVDRRCERWNEGGGNDDDETRKAAMNHGSEKREAKKSDYALAIYRTIVR